jgi:hypothetical protein
MFRNGGASFNCGFGFAPAAAAVDDLQAVVVSSEG